MFSNARYAPVALLAAFVAWSLADVQAQASPNGHPPAGQVCPQGSFVSGFDAAGNILCSEPTDGQPAGTPAAAAPMEAAPAASAPTTARPVEATPAAAPLPASTTTAPVVSDIEPSSALYGGSEVRIAITGSGFTSATRVVFQGETYEPSVNPAGTELRVSLRTRALPIGRYPVTVTNGPGMESVVRKGLEIF